MKDHNIFRALREIQNRSWMSDWERKRHLLYFSAKSTAVEKTSAGVYTNRISEIYLETIRSVSKRGSVIWNSGSWGARRRGAAVSRKHPVERRNKHARLHTHTRVHIHIHTHTGRDKRSGSAKAVVPFMVGRMEHRWDWATHSQPVATNRKCLQIPRYCVWCTIMRQCLLRNIMRVGQRDIF